MPTKSLRFATVLAMALLFAFLGGFWTSRNHSVYAQFFNPQPDPPGFGIIGVIVSETARVNVLCIDHKIAGTPPDPCTVQIQFRNASNTVLKGATLSLNPGQYGHVDVAASSLKFPDGQNRLELRPNVEFQSGHVLATAETFDTNTGQTHVFTNAAVPRLSLIVQ